MSPHPRSLVAAALLGLALISVSSPIARAEDLKTEVRLLTSEGRFEDANKMLDGDEALKNDAEFRAALADAALLSAKPKKGEAKRRGVHAAIAHLQAAIARGWAGEGDFASVTAAALESAFELADLEVVAKNPKAAVITSNLGVDLVVKAVKAETTDAGLLVAAADIHQKRADLSHVIEDMERIINDLGRAGELLAKAAETHREGPKVMGWAARAYIKQAQFVSDKIPLETEKRDDEAVAKAIALATKACESETATDEVFTVHLLAIRAARTMGVKDISATAFMEPVKPPVELLELKMPRGGIWKTRKTEDWDFHATRQYEGEDKSVEVLLKIWDHDEALYGVTMGNVEKVVEIRAESQVEKFKEVKSQSLPHVLGDPVPDPADESKKKKKPKKKKKAKPKKGETPKPEVWHFRIVGIPTVKNTPQQLAEFFWSDPKAGITYQIRILDWGTPWGVDDEDVAQFLRSAFGDQWPEAAAIEDPKKKK